MSSPGQRAHHVAVDGVPRGAQAVAGNSPGAPPDALQHQLNQQAWQGARVRLGLAAALALPPLCLAWGQPEPELLGLALASGVAAALVCAPMVWASTALAALPLLVLPAAPTDSAWPWAALAASAMALGCAQLMRLDWRRRAMAALQQAQRIAQLEHERDAAHRTDQDKSRFLANASHDLRQPVHALGLFAASLQRRLVNSSDEPLARNLVRAVDGLERSFNAMLDISKLDAGALSPKVETFPLRDMFRRLHMQYAGHAEFAGLGLRFAPGGKSVNSDPQLLERIMGNLIQNAIKYTAHGGIVVVARNVAAGVNVEVWDTGPGIAAAELPRIFGEFYQVGRGERDRAHGLGMGLAIVKRLAALLGHRLEVASTPGKGTVFRITVPAGGLPGIDEDLAPHDTQPMVWLSTQTILVVDDEEPIREGLLMLLQEWGFQAMTAANAQQAEQAVTALEGRVDLVLTDLHLGGGPDGVEVIAAVRRLCGRDIPAILVTGDTAHGAESPVLAGSDLVLFKPVQPRRLFDALREALG
jgi:signal transduction histidine kinase/CheY-like chemotaxis protein